MKKVILSLLLVFPFLVMGHWNPVVKTYSLQEAIKKNIIKLEEVVYAGENKLRIKITNPHKRKSVKIHFKTGLQFASRDSSEQDRIILDERTILVKAGETKVPSFANYCTQASNRSPKKGSFFDLKEQADGKLLELAAYLADIDDINYMAQQAVWVVTDDHDLKGLYHANAMTAIKIQKFVAKLTGKPLPKYTIRYKDGRENEVAFTGEAVLICGVHEYRLEKDVLVSCKIFNEAGEMVQEVFKDMEQRAGGNRFSFKLKALDLPKGKYVSKVFIDGEVFQERWVES